MASLLTYAGVSLDLPSPHAEKFRDMYIPQDHLEFIQQFDGREHAPRLSPFTIYKPPVKPKLRIGEIYYPSGGSRWMEVTFIVTSTQLAAIEAIVIPTGTAPQPQPLVIQADPIDLQGQVLAGDAQATGGVTISNVYMLPPRSFAQNVGTLDNLYLLTLVDERYYFPYLSTAVLTPDGTSVTWDALIGQVCTSLGINTLTSGNPSAYGFPDPDSPIWSSYERGGELLEALCGNVGRYVVRGYNGTYSLQTAPQCAIAGNNPIYRTAGSPLVTVNEANTILPQSVVVTFPKYQDNVGYIDTRHLNFVEKPSYGAVYTKTVTLASIYSQFTGFVGKKDIHDTCKAFFPNAGGTGTPDNDTLLGNLATQLATDYYDLKINTLPIDEVYPGIRNWTPTGIHDIIWSYRKDWLVTRVFSKPWNWEALEFCHANQGTGVLASGTSLPPQITVLDANPNSLTILTNTVEIDRTNGLKLSNDVGKAEIGLNIFGASGPATHGSGAVPDPGAVSGTLKFLREDATWARPPGQLIAIQQIATLGVSTYTPTAGATQAWVWCYGSGGGGGGVVAGGAGTGTAGSGGSAGGWAFKQVAAVSKNVTVAAGGTAGAAGGGNGGNGSPSIFDNASPQVEGVGGVGGLGDNAAIGAAFIKLGGFGAVGTPLGTIFSILGVAGGPGLGIAAGLTLGGRGAESLGAWGSFGANETTNTAGSNGGIPGGGGSGASSFGVGSAAQAGGAGGQGLIIIFEFA